MKNKVITTIKNRVSCRQYNNKRVPLAKVLEIVEAGKMAPSALNRQISNILVVRSKKYVEPLRKLSIEAREKDAYYGANTLVIVYGPKDDRFTIQDCSCILENIFIAATALNVQSCWINQTEDLLNSKKGLKIRKKLGIGEDKLIVGTAILGYANDPSALKVKERKEDFIKVI